ncbi:prenyltransferase/squalene oxidase repeat-containing protein [Spirillospora sp. CA-294931]|uniref:prenyltransferase/squalene oxidase repeat-containing protein n=1 Tax=Spirillospora sp. CA-294931 TaxID=3240042 RepID=UPI003D941D82
MTTTAPEGPAAPRTPSSARITESARELLAGLRMRPWGQVSPSVYETARLVSLTPWLTGHDRRVSFLLERQRPEGLWTAPDRGYALVPTLSAIEALLCLLSGTATATEPVTADRPRLAEAASRGLRAMSPILDGRPWKHPLPDMPAIELITPYLIELINDHLAALRERPVDGLGAWAGHRLTAPEGLDGTKLTAVRRLLAMGGTVPTKLVHALEVAGDTAVELPNLRTEPTGTIGASPAATAAWLGDREPLASSSPARWHLETVAADHGGPVPCGYPLTVFERSWVLAWLVRAGISFVVHPELVLSLTAPLGPTGTPAAAGLPADADTTSGALYALALLGAPHRPDPLWAYELDTHFCTWEGEDGASLTTNAHVLEAFGQYLRSVPSRQLDEESGRAYGAAVRKVSTWLCEQQAPDGNWTDRWHASPYYATACCAIPLHTFGGERAEDAVAAARRWILDTQRPDGSWGRWGGTAEETAYAVQVLLLTGPSRDGAIGRAAAAARPHLQRHLALRDGEEDDAPALWHDKDLYKPTAIVRAAVLAALHLTQVKAVVPS